MNCFTVLCLINERRLGPSIETTRKPSQEKKIEKYLDLLNIA